LKIIFDLSLKKREKERVCVPDLHISSNIFLIRTEKNDFAERSKIFLDLKIILLDHQNFVGTLKIMNIAEKSLKIF